MTRLFAFALSVIVLTVSPALASSVYRVTGVKVDASADSAAAAREKAIVEGRRAAFHKLLTRLTLKKDKALWPTPSDADLRNFLQSLEVKGERNSQTRYLAELTVSFKPNAIRQLLRDSELPFSETPSKPMLVLPIYDQDGALLLWDSPNPWLEAWREGTYPDDLVPIVLPEANLQDIAIISPRQAVAGNKEQLKAIADHYKAGQVLVAKAVIGRDFSTGRPRLTVELMRHQGEDTSTIVESFPGTVNASAAIYGMLVEAAETVAAEVEEQWKAQTLIRFGEEGRMSFFIPLDHLQAWVDIRTRLQAVPLVQQVTVDSITSRHVNVTLDYLGMPEQLKLALAQKDLSVGEGEGYYLLSRSNADKPEERGAVPLAQ